MVDLKEPFFLKGGNDIFSKVKGNQKELGQMVRLKGNEESTILGKTIFKNSIENVLSLK